MVSTTMTEKIPAKPNHFYGKHARIDSSSLRYKFMQALSLVLWGRKIEYMTWWQHAARSSSVMVFNKDAKLLLGRRDNSFDGNKKYSTIGGFVDNFETFAQATSRELKEESGLIIPPSAFTTANLFCIDQRRSSIKEQSEMPSVSTIYVYHISDDELKNLHTTNEFSEFIWVNEAELDTLYNNNELGFDHNYKMAKQAFAEGWHKGLPDQRIIHEGSTL